MTKLFIRNIPKGTRERDLVRFIKPAVRSLIQIPFRPSPLVGCEVLAIMDKTEDTIEFHGLADIEPDKVAQRAIRRLNKTRLKGRVVSVREFYQRSWHNDRRSPRTDDASHTPERRVKDRRRQNLEFVDDIAKKYCDLENFDQTLL